MTNHDATKFDQAFLINKFYERYPLPEFKSDSERAEALGYFMAGALILAEIEHIDRKEVE